MYKKLILKDRIMCILVLCEEMGNCVPVPASKLKSSSFSRTECVPIERSNRQNPIGAAMPRASSFQELDAKEEVHFSPDPWFHADCEDFFSVNGDLTPSSSNTPIHPDSKRKTPQIDESLCLEPHEPDVKRQLIELFRERSSDESGSEAEPSNCDSPGNSAHKIAYESVAGIVLRSVASSNTNLNQMAKKATQFAECCSPKLFKSLSFSERKRR